MSAYVLDAKGLAAAACKMAFGNKLGVTIDKALGADELFVPGIGNILAEVPAGKETEVYAAMEKAGITEFEIGRAHV